MRVTLTYFDFFILDQEHLGITNLVKLDPRTFKNRSVLSSWFPRLSWFPLNPPIHLKWAMPNTRDVVGWASTWRRWSDIFSRVQVRMWSNGLQHGQGILEHQNGSKHEGMWSKGLRHGKETYRYPCKSKIESYCGDWKSNV